MGCCFTPVYLLKDNLWHRGSLTGGLPIRRLKDGFCFLLRSRKNIYINLSDYQFAYYSNIVSQSCFLPIVILGGSEPGNF